MNVSDEMINRTNNNKEDDTTNNQDRSVEKNKKCFLKENIGRLIKLDFLIGKNNMVTKFGFLEDVGDNCILIRTLENENLMYADIETIKFITVLTPYNSPSYQNINNHPYMPNMNNYY